MRQTHAKRPICHGAVYRAMVEKAKAVNVLKAEHNQVVTCLVSGGAAFADHVAVDLFLGGVVKDLCLYLHADFDRLQARYQELSMRPFGDSGKIANFYHRNFSRIIERDSLRQLGEALKSPWCRYQVGSGFMHRNSLIAANSDALLAMTFGNGPCVKEKSGTADTVRKFQKHHPHAPCFHTDLGQLLCYRKAVRHNTPLMLLLPGQPLLHLAPPVTDGSDETR